MKNWQKKRQSDRKAQEAYWKEHRYCEVCKFEGRGQTPAWEIHEIVFRSRGGKCEPDNMIAVCRNDHMRAHYTMNPWLAPGEVKKMKELKC